MRAMNRSRQWLLAVFWCAAVAGLPYTGRAAERMPLGPGQVTVMVMVQGAGQERNQVVENTLTQVFLRHGYKVIDAATVTQSLRRHAYLLKQAETEAAKRLGSRLGADIVVSGEAKSRVVDKTYTLFEGKKVILSQAEVTVKAVQSGSGRIIAAENASQRKPFDTTGQIALQMAAESAAGKLIHGIEEFLHRDTTDYRLVVLNVDDSQALTLQQNLRHRVKGVRQVEGYSAKQQISELKVSVEKDQDLPFKQYLLSQPSALGLGPLAVVAREGEKIYLHQAGGPMLPQQEAGVRRPPPNAVQGGASSAVPAIDTAKYNRGYRKSWAVLIGINDYQQWPKLRYAVNDARSVEHLLKELGFTEVIRVLDGDATKQRILRILGDELYTQTHPDDRVFIFFAGHGQTQDLPTGGKEGYLIPVDGDLNNYYSTAIRMQELQGLADRISAKHIFYAMDACFSGLLLRNFRGEGLNDSPMQLTIAPVRQVLTAGDEGEKVIETGGHGLFTKSLLSALAGKADLNKDGHITGTELSRYITAQVMAESRNSQNPLFGRLGDGSGEFVFQRQ